MSTRSRTKGRFAMIPVEVMQSPAYHSLPYYARAVLMAVAAQYHGGNNGDLEMTWETARAFGIFSKEHLVNSLKLLLARGLIVKTRQGGKRPMGPTLYALTWRPIDDLRPKIYTLPTTVPTDDWKNWSTGLPADRGKKNRRDCRRTATGLPADLETPVTGLPADREGRINGTAGSPPLRSEAVQGLRAVPIAIATVCGRRVRLEPVEVQQ